MDSSKHSETNAEITEIKEETKEFKQFDVVEDYSDHHFANTSLAGNQNGTTAKKIMREWKILEENLPGSIYVRVYEGRIDLLTAAIVGASGTPYHDGLFFFDILFPSDYPAQPPSVHYRSYGLRINPNLYADGTVCLSLLNTWPGKKTQRWDSSNSTILQVLLSIQALVLNRKPYFNEPYILPAMDWDKKSLAYNQDTFALSCKTMLFVLRNMPRHFEDLVTAHFSERAHLILVASKAYMDGVANIGCVVENGSVTYSVARGTKSKKFKMVMERLYPELVKAFHRTGAPVEQFIEQVKTDEAATKSTTQTVREKKKGFTRKILNQVKKFLGLSKEAKGSSSHSRTKALPPPKKHH